MKFIFINKEPVGIPVLRTNICMRCGKMINRKLGDACSAIPPEDRFNFINEDEV